LADSLLSSSTPIAGTPPTAYRRCGTPELRRGYRRRPGFPCR
jgi:hypothetical protein